MKLFAFLIGCLSSVALAQPQLATSSSGSPYDIPSEIPENVFDTPNTTLKNLEVEGTCGENTKIKLKIAYKTTSQVSVFLWGSFPQTTKTLPIGQGEKIFEITGPVLECKKFKAMDVFAALGTSRALRTSYFWTPASRSTDPAIYYPIGSETPSGITLNAVNLFGGCDQKIGVDFDVTSTKAASAKVYLDAVDGTAQLNSITIPASSRSVVKYNKTSKVIDCDALRSITGIDFNSRFVFGFTTKFGNTGVYVPNGNKIFAVGSDVAFPKKP